MLHLVSLVRPTRGDKKTYVFVNKEVLIIIIETVISKMNSVIRKKKLLAREKTSSQT